MWYWLVVLTLILGVAFGLQNPQPVDLYLFDTVISLPLSVALLIALSSGIVFGWLMHSIQRVTRKSS